MEKKDLQSIVDEFLKYDVSSESEVRSKLIDHLIVFLGYPPELRAEEFPVYGYNDDNQQRAKPADYITFKSNDYVQHKGKKSQASLEWVRNNSLLVFEAKNKDEMPENLNQPAYYATWTRAVAYLVCDGERIKGYYYKDCTADREIIDCKVEELPKMESFDYFSYENILAMKERRLTANPSNEMVVKIRDSYNKGAESNVQIITCEEDLNIPEGTINYMREALGKDSIGLNNLQLTAKFLNLTDALLQNRIRYDIPMYMLGIPREFHDVLIYTDNDIIPLFDAKAIHSYRNDDDIYQVENEYIRVVVHTLNGNVDNLIIGFQVFDNTVSERLIKFRKINALFEANIIRVYIKNSNQIYFSFIPSSALEYKRIFAKNQSDYRSIELLKEIEDYYGIKFKLSIIPPEKIIELFEKISTIHNGINHLQNYIINLPQESFRDIPDGIQEIEEPETFRNAVDLGFDEIKLFNILFVPDTYTILPSTLIIAHESKEPVSYNCCCTYKLKE